MPLVQIEIEQGRDRVFKDTLMDTVHGALVEALGIPEDDRFMRLIEHAPEDFETKGNSWQKVLVEIKLFAGRTIETKRKLYQMLNTRVADNCGLPLDAVFTVLVEIPLDNWGIREGVPASEVQLGFKVEV